MKVRVKLFGTIRPVEVGESELCTLSELRSKAVDTFQLSEKASVELSLNRQDPLSGEEQTLSQLGIVPGDTLHILCQQQGLPSNTSNNANGAHSAASSASSSSSNCSGDTLAQGGGLAQRVSDDVHGSADDEKTESKITQQEPLDPSSMMSLGPQHYAGTSNEDQSVGNGAACNGSSDGVEGAAFVEQERRASPSPLEDPEVNRCLQEPLLCRESSSSAVPALLRDWYSWANCVVPAEALWVVVHTLMMEVGFRPLQEANVAFAEGWNRGFYKLDYRHLCVNTQHRCSLMAVPMGPTLVLHGVADGDPQMKTENQNIKINDYVYGISHDVCRVFKNIDRLSRFVKDLVCQPLLSHLSEVCGYPVSLGLLSLSYELKLKVLSYLPANSVTMVGQVCPEYNATYKDPCLWRRLYLREFGRNGDNSLNKDWYALYKEEHQARKERRKACRFRHQMLTGIPPWLNPPGGHFPPPPSMPYPGGIIGGEYDFNPEFASTIHHPLLGRRPQGMNPFLPMGPGGPGGLVGPGGLAGPFPPRPRFNDPFAPGAFPDPFMALGGAPASRNSRPSAFGSLGGNRFL